MADAAGGWRMQQLLARLVGQRPPPAHDERVMALSEEFFTKNGV